MRSFFFLSRWFRRRVARLRCVRAAPTPVRRTGSCGTSCPENAAARTERRSESTRLSVLHAIGSLAERCFLDCRELARRVDRCSCQFGSGNRSIARSVLEAEVRLRCRTRALLKSRSARCAALRKNSGEISDSRRGANADSHRCGGRDRRFIADIRRHDRQPRPTVPTHVDEMSPALRFVTTTWSSP